MPALKPKLTDQEFVMKLAEYVSPSSELGHRVDGYRIVKVTANTRSGRFSCETLYDHDILLRQKEATAAFYSTSRKAQRAPDAPEDEKSPLYYATLVRDGSILLVTGGAKEGEFIALAPVYRKGRQKTFVDGLRNLPPGVPYVTGWPSMQKRSMVFYAYFEEISKSWGDRLARGHMPSELPGQAQAGLPGLFATHRILRLEFRLCAFVYCDEDDNVLGFDDVSLKLAASMPVAEAGRNLPARLAGYQIATERLQHAEEWLRTTATAPAGTTRVYYAESDQAFMLMKGATLRDKNPRITYRVRCVRRLSDTRTEQEACVTKEEFIDRLTRYGMAAGVAVREHTDVTPAAQNRLRLASGTA